MDLTTAVRFDYETTWKGKRRMLERCQNLFLCRTIPFVIYW